MLVVDVHWLLYLSAAPPLHAASEATAVRWGSPKTVTGSLGSVCFGHADLSSWLQRLACFSACSVCFQPWAATELFCYLPLKKISCDLQFWLVPMSSRALSPSQSYSLSTKQNFLLKHAHNSELELVALIWLFVKYLPWPDAVTWDFWILEELAWVPNLFELNLWWVGCI